MWMVESWRGRLLQLLIGLERGQTGKSHKQSGRPTVHSCAVSWASPKRRLAVASGLWGLSLAAQTSPDHPALYVFGITLGIVSCTHVTDTIPVYSRGEFHSEAAWANTPTPGNPPSPPSLLWGWEQPSLVLAFAEVTLATHTVSWAGTGGLPPEPAFSLLRSAHEPVFPQMSPERPDPGGASGKPGWHFSAPAAATSQLPGERRCGADQVPDWESRAAGGKGRLRDGSSHRLGS